MLKVLNIITNGINSNGIASSWLALCKELQQSYSKSEVQLCFTYSEDNSNSETIKKFENYGIRTISTPSRTKNTIKYILFLIRVLRAEKFDIIHVNGSSSLMLIEMIAGFVAGTQLRIAHSRNTTCLNPKLHKLLKYPFRQLVNGRLACGLDAGKWLFGNVPFKVLHNGKDFTEFSYSEQLRQKYRTELGLNHKVVIGHVGRFNAQKNHSFLIDIFKRITDKVPNTVLILVGDGILKDKISKKVDQLGLSDKVIFTGSSNQVSKILQTTDLMLLPSLYEGLPNVVLEWQAVGLRCIISDKITKECSVSDLVHFNSIESTPDQWATHALSIISQPYDRLSDSIRAKQNLKDAGFDIKYTAQELLNYYQYKISELSK